MNPIYHAAHDQAVIRTLQPFTEFDATVSVAYDAAASRTIGKDYWRVTQGFKFYLFPRIDALWVYVPEGFLTDGASVPQLFWNILPPWGKYGQAAVLHDWLCEHLVADNTKPNLGENATVVISKKQADRQFYWAMKALGVTWWKRQVMYRAVRFYSWIHHIKGVSIYPPKEAYLKSLEASQPPAATPGDPTPSVTQPA